MSQAPRQNDKPPTPADQVRQLYEQAEAQTAKAMEELVNRESFGEALARVTENVVALTRMSNDTLDLVVRNLRVAGRNDITRLGRQLARTEDKLETVLQEIERLGDQVRAQGQERAQAGSSPGADSDTPAPTPTRALEPGPSPREGQPSERGARSSA